MIKLKELLNLNELTYNDGPSEKHQRRMNYPITMFNEITIEEVPFPENTGKETLDELKYLASLEMNPDFAKEHDDVEEVFGKKHKELELEFNKEEAKGLLKQSAKYIMELKYKYQRPRPYQVAEFYDMDLNGKELDSMKTPSYPSGHAVQGYLMGMIYSERHPEYREVFTQLGEDIAHSRINAKAHFPSDKKFGKEIAERLFDNLI
jgi:hypothetical protein